MFVCKSWVNKADLDATQYLLPGGESYSPQHDSSVSLHDPASSNPTLLN